MSAVPFVAQLNASNNAYDAVRLLNTTNAPAIATDSTGNVYFAGSAIAPSGASLIGPGGPYDVVVTKLDSSLSKVFWQLFIGGSGQNVASGIAVDGAGNVYVTGSTTSTDWPLTADAFQSVNRASNGTGYVAVVAASGSSLLWSTYLGGSDSDNPRGIAIGPSGSVYVAGTTSSTDFPVTAGALQTVGRGGGFISQISADGNKLLASTYLAGADGNASILSLASDPDGSITVAGDADAQFPVTLSGGTPSDVTGFVARLNANLTSLVFSEFIGGNPQVNAMSDAQVNSIFVDAKDVTYVAGYTPGGLSTIRAVQPEFYAAPCGTAICNEGFFAQLDPSGKVLLSTYLNGDFGDIANAVASDGNGAAFIGGSGVLTIGGSQMPQSQGAAFLVTLNVNLTPPLLLFSGVTNAASFATGLPPPGSLGTIFCSGLTGIPSLAAPTFPFPLIQDGVTVTIGGTPAPIVAIANFGSYQQINFQVPWSIPFSSHAADIEVSQDDVAAWITQADFLRSPPGIFTVDGTDGAIQHADYSLVTASNPAQPGEVVLVYGTGLGPVSTPIASDELGPNSPLDITSQPVSVTVAGQSARVLYAGLAPDELGLYQINIQLPQSISPREQDLVISLANVTDQKPPYFSPTSYPRQSARVKIAIQ